MLFSSNNIKGFKVGLTDYTYQYFDKKTVLNIYKRTYIYA